jgi:hypothetical protein
VESSKTDNQISRKTRDCQVNRGFFVWKNQRRAHARQNKERQKE